MPAREEFPVRVANDHEITLEGMATMNKTLLPYDVQNGLATLIVCLKDGLKINAIKAVREMTDCSLYEAKNIMESFLNLKAPAPVPVCADDYAYGYYVLTRSPNTELNEFCDVWRCNEGDSTLSYARCRAQDAVENVSEGETVFIMKVVSRSVTTTTMKDV